MHWGMCGSMMVNFESKTESIKLWNGNLTKSHTHTIIVYFQRFDLVKACHAHFLEQLLSNGFNWKVPVQKDLAKFEEDSPCSYDTDMDSGSESDSD